jgi:hypothetical protein
MGYEGSMVSIKRPSAEAVATARNEAGAIVGSPA